MVWLRERQRLPIINSTMQLQRTIDAPRQATRLHATLRRCAALCCLPRSRAPLRRIKLHAKLISGFRLPVHVHRCLSVCVFPPSLVSFNVQSPNIVLPQLLRSSILSARGELWVERTGPARRQTLWSRALEQRPIVNYRTEEQARPSGCYWEDFQQNSLLHLSVVSTLSYDCLFPPHKKNNRAFVNHNYEKKVEMITYLAIRMR